MRYDPFANSPFYNYFPVTWPLSESGSPVHSLTRNHTLSCRLHCHHIGDGLDDSANDEQIALISYEVNGRFYRLYSLADMLAAPYDFDERGMSNLRGDLAERIARRVMKRFLQTHDRGFGRMGGLFDQKFDPKHRENFVVAHNQTHVLKIGKYPNLILLAKTGHGKWGYQHVTDLDGLFDYRYAHHRHMIVLESKVGRIDIQPESLFEQVLTPLQQLFPEAGLTYVLMADRSHLLETKYPEYRILSPAGSRIHEFLSERRIPCLFFEFRESDSDFTAICRHLTNCYRAYHHQAVNFIGRTQITDQNITIYAPGGNLPYMRLEKDPITGYFKVIKSPR